MRILSLDTSFSFFNFSVIEEGRVVLLHYNDSSRKTLEKLPSEISRAGIDLTEFDAYAVSVGIGYLTSVRIGITFIKTVSYLCKKPVIAYENLNLLQKFTPGVEDPVPYLRVSRNIFYLDPESGKARIFEGERIKGTPVTVESSYAEEMGSSQVIHKFFPFSAYGGVYANERLSEDPKGDNPFSLEPLYLRPPL